MKNPAIRFILICISVVIAHVSVTAQDPTLSAAAGERYVISARAGGINFVEGTVNVARRGGKSGQLVKGDTIEVGDRVTTGNDGKVEILLNPGSYLRLGGNSAFEFVTTSLDDLQLKIDRGSAILEVFAAEDFKVNVVTPASKYILVQTGVYRLDVPEDSQTRLRVWKGLARTSADQTIKSGRIALTNAGGQVSVAKFDRDQRDGLDLWSRARSKELAKLTAQLKRDSLRPILMRSFLGRSWNLFNSFGLWVYNPFFGGYCFLPFGHGWSSPYGYGFGHSLWWYEMPPIVYMPPASSPTTPGGNTNQPATTPIVSAGTRGPIPPFVRLQDSSGSGVRGGSPDRGDTSYDSSSSSPSYSPPPSSPPPASPGTFHSETTGGKGKP